MKASVCASKRAFSRSDSVRNGPRSWLWRLTGGSAGPQCRLSAVYSMLYMASVRTQIYLTEQQRVRLNDRAQRQGVRMAQIIRDAIDSFLSTEDDVEATFGAAPDIARKLPSRDEWDQHG